MFNLGQYLTKYKTMVLFPCFSFQHWLMQWKWLQAWTLILLSIHCSKEKSLVSTDPPDLCLQLVKNDLNLILSLLLLLKDAGFQTRVLTSRPSPMTAPPSRFSTISFSMIASGVHGL